ncbi:MULTISPECIES: dTDP-4-dehydrorhamnose reductase [unclassified Achromobacter]|uniref:dTDP-4-dehydrorhamnose reductase n=1 Tax=unclassified Achromobacter TaxID=2626865 RepID=UPI000B518A90|nr:MULTISPECIES: dTDP-4-dehydrorhamnose reductase [unclassified Achromobacter]OWT74967.1 dTDP-4-dehydrorhamnose reductase [Achromobacter sp. HZ28]OWT76575.1 dTDP-4-dehydrorhamnose reductase [Achromobacter sp. HZ34]
MKILLLGCNGQVGWELQRALAPLAQVTALGRTASGDLRGDLADTEGLAQTVRALAPDVIVNAAAYTAVDKAESEVSLAQAINAEAPGVLAREAARSGALLVHYSTDYVFDGSGNTPWREDDQTGPLSVYGSSKLAGEQKIVASGCRHLIFRTSWVYAARGGNFAKTMLRLAGERDRLSVIDDQFGAPTGADLIADVTAQAIVAQRGNPSLAGIYHLAAAGVTSWHAYARFVLHTAGDLGITLRATPDAVDAVPSTAYKTAAQRPMNSRLDTRKLAHDFQLRLPLWENGVARMLAEVLEK